MKVSIFRFITAALVVLTTLGILAPSSDAFMRGGVKATTTQTNVVIALGQSNMLGGGTGYFDTGGQSLAANLGSGAQQGWFYPPTAGVDTGLQIFVPNSGMDYSNILIPGWHIGTSTGVFAPLLNGWNNSGLSYQPPPAYPTTSSTAYQDWGPVPEFAWLWRQNKATPLYIINFPVSGTPLCAASGEDWNVASTGKLYAIAKNIIAAALSQIPNPTIVTVLWMQGETDAVDGTCAAAYQTNLTNFISSFRTDVDSGRSTPFIIGRIRSSDGGSASVVRAAQDTFNGGTNTTVVDTDSYPLQGDAVHYTAQGQCCSVGTSGFNPASGGLGADMYNAGHTAGFY